MAGDGGKDGLILHAPPGAGEDGRADAVPDRGRPLFPALGILGILPHQFPHLILGDLFGRVVERAVGSLQHLDVGQTSVLLDHEGYDHAALDAVLEGDLREAHVLLYPVAEGIEVSALERGHRLGHEERLVVLDLLLDNLDLLDHLGVLIELGKGYLGADLRIVVHNLEQVGDYLDLHLLGRLGRLLVLTGNLRKNLFDNLYLLIEFLDLALLRGVPEGEDDQAQRYDETDFEQKTPLVLKVRFG